MFASPAYADWEKVAVGKNGDTFYVDFDRIRTNGGYVYWWDLSDYLTPQYGVLSSKVYNQGDCEMFSFKSLTIMHYKQPMGEGSVGEINSPPDPKWIYVPPKSSVEGILKQVCAVAENL